MFNNLTIAEWIGPTRHPPRSLIRPILVFIDLRGLRPFVLHHFRTEAMESSTRDRVPWFFFVIDETCFFTYAQYVEAFTPSMTYAMRWSIGSFKPGAFIFAQLCSTYRLLIDMDKTTLSMVNILSSRSWGAYHPLWFRGGDQHGFLSQPVSPFCPYVLSLTCTGATIDNSASH